jgi:hypothetical protein
MTETKQTSQIESRPYNDRLSIVGFQDRELFVSNTLLSQITSWEEYLSWVDKKICNSPRGINGQHFDMSGLVIKEGQKEDGYLERAINNIQQYNHEDTVNLIRDLDKDKIILDLGCGIGSCFSHYLFRTGKISQLLSLDIDPRNLINNLLPGLKILANAENIPLLNNSVDFIICRG